MTIQFTIPDELVEKIILGIMENYPEAGHGNALQCIAWQYRTLNFKIEDEEMGARYDLDKTKLVATFPMMFTDKWPKGCTKPPLSDKWDEWENWLGQSDATDFDAFVQLACLGEVIYG